MTILSKKMRSLTLIESWNNANRLSSLFGAALALDNVFEYIYVAIRDNPASAADEDIERYTYHNVGFTTTEISRYFNMRYGLNYFYYDYNKTEQYDTLIEKLKIIYAANKYKYMKLIEVLGYKYNPLYNVDGSELYANMESIGDSKTNRKPEGTIRSTTGTLENNVIGKSTTTNYTNPFTDNTSSTADFVENKVEQDPVTNDQTYQEYTEKTELNNEPATNFIYNSETEEYVKGDIFSMAAKDSAFGVPLNGAERYYAEKRIRQGNIGVTKSTELISAQRDIVKFNILDEFMRDLEKDLVVGIY